MAKFSIVIPVYNVENYIEKCINSVLEQSFKDYEVIVVNDGTKDNSIEKIKDMPVKIINKENGGLSDARNVGAKEAKGEYLIFLDSDDYWDKDLLKELNNSTKNYPDLIRFQIRTVSEDNICEDYNEEKFDSLNGVDAFNKIVKYHFVENAWAYAIKRKYYEKEKFEFKKGTIHEDYGLIPLVIIKSKKVNSIEYVGYNYLQRTGSIMNQNNYDKTLKKVDDFYNHYLYLEEEINKTNLDKKVFLSYISNSVMLKICELKHKDYKKYLKKLRKNHIYKNLLKDTMTRKIKAILQTISPKICFKIIK